MTELVVLPDLLGEAANTIVVHLSGGRKSGASPRHGFVELAEDMNLGRRVFAKHFEHAGKTEIHVAGSHERQPGRRTGGPASTRTARHPDLQKREVELRGSKVPDNRLADPLGVRPDARRTCSCLRKFQVTRNTCPREFQNGDRG